MALATGKKRYLQPTSKGQVTLPIAIRRQLAIEPHTLLTVTIDHGRIVLEPLLKQSTDADRWETVVDFTEFDPNGLAMEKLQTALRSWTKSTKR